MNWEQMEIGRVYEIKSNMNNSTFRVKVKSIPTHPKRIEFGLVDKNDNFKDEINFIWDGSDWDYWSIKEVGKKQLDEQLRQLFIDMALISNDKKWFMELTSKENNVAHIN
jgi:hypothetical protein